MTPHEIPLQPSTPQLLTTQLGGITYNLSVHWNDGAQLWILDIADINNNNVLSGVPLVTGADLLAQYKYLNIGNGGQLIVQSDNDPDETPDFNSLGVNGHLYFVTNP